jgi:hypothetical protein
VDLQTGPPGCAPSRWLLLTALVAAALAPPPARAAPADSTATALAPATAPPAAVAKPAAVKAPSAFLGFNVGADRVLADYKQIAAYFRHLAAASPRVDVEVLGKTTLGEDMLMAVISSEANLRDKDRFKTIARRLADPRGLDPAEQERLVREGKVIVVVTCNIHSTEIASSQMAMEWAHALATADDPETRRRLDSVILLLVPSLNPDGQTLETSWYRKYRGTRWEGGRMPWLYHHYVGHDNNRDWFMLTQKETRNLTRALYHEWLPQLFVDEHQMGGTGPRIFIPPYADPIDPDVHPLIWREINLIGSTMAYRLEQAGKPGAIFGYSYDGYWLGGTRNTGWWKNITGLLIEVASARLATPVLVEPTELEGRSKGLLDYQPQANYPNPWRGGWWRMRDIMDYERVISDALLEVATNHRGDLLRGLAVRARAALADARPGEAYRIPAAQRNYPTARRLAALMADHAVEVLAAPDGDLWIPLHQPYGRFVREMLEPQRYPEVRQGEGREILRPYDVATWTLPLMMGVTVEKTVLPEARPAGLTRLAAPILGKGDLPLPSGAAIPDGALAIEPNGPEVARVLTAALRGGGQVRQLRATASAGGRSWPPGTVLLDAAAAKQARAALTATGVRALPAPPAPADAVKLRLPRVGLYKPWTASMDEGWTRWVLEQYGFAPVALDNKSAQAGNLRARFDAIILPSMDKEMISTGRAKRDEGAMKYFTDLPPEYTGGLDAKGGEAEGGGDSGGGGGDSGGGRGKPGTRALKAFVEAGGTLIAFGVACDYVTDAFNIPVRNLLGKVTRAEFSVPGSLLRALVPGDHPVTWGLPREVALFVDEGIAFETALPGPELQRRVLAHYPEAKRDVLLSGWSHGEDRLVRRAAAVATTFGKGKIVLLGFRPQNRGQTHATFPFLFNALWWSVN